MHTQLTAELDEILDWDVEKWILETLVRQYGLFDLLKDNKEHLNIEQLQESLKLPKRFPPPPKPLPNDDELMKLFVESTEELRKQKIEIELKQIAYYKAVCQIKIALVKDNHSQFLQDLLELAEKQLKSIERDFSTDALTAQINQSFKKFKEIRMAKYKWEKTQYDSRISDYKKAEAETPGQELYGELIKEVTTLFKDVREEISTKLSYDNLDEG